MRFGNSDVIQKVTGAGAKTVKASSLSLLCIGLTFTAFNFISSTYIGSTYIGSTCISSSCIISNCVASDGLVSPANGQPVDGKASPPTINFAREVLPILSNKCFVCHGPDSRDDDLVRLDSYEGATADLGGYQAIDADTPKESEILTRIHSPDDPMPPEDSEKQLTERERELISQWIRQGGKYTKHWAFVLPQKQSPTESGYQGEPSKNIIDDFISAQLQKNNIAFSPPADRPTLARRAALALTGLPPEPALLKTFLNDSSPQAYTRLVDALMESPRFGEHQARYWLDAIRYGDTHGLHLDNKRGIFSFRDWVVTALNDNLPLDDFITWQLAGDLLPNPTLAQRVATGFVRMNPSTAEGGVIPAEFQAKNNFDRTETLGTVLLGMSLTCARCHTHKYDPIPQVEYYRLMAFFNSTSENPLDGNSYTYGPVLKAPENQAAWQHWQKLERERDSFLVRANKKIAPDVEQLVAHAKEKSQWRSSDWQISTIQPIDADKPSTEHWSPAKNLPGQDKTNVPKRDKAVWVAFEVNTTVDSTIHLSFISSAGARLWINGAEKPVKNLPTDGVQPTRLPLNLSQGKHSIQLKIAGHKTLSHVEVKLADDWQSLATTADWSSCSTDEQLRILADQNNHFSDPTLRRQASELHRQIETATSTFTTTLVAQELAQPRETRLLNRGEYNLPVGEALQPGIISAMGSFPSDAPRNRLGLAQWLTSREHPLVSRVMVNQLWQRVFGVGLVRTPEDFGLQGEQPTHPMLLDWLAVELQDSGWDLKKMLRMMVTSQTFQQSSARRSDLSDPENRLFARGPSYRLDAEVLRDIALWGSQLLDPQRGGEGVKPYQPDGLWLALAHPASNTKKYVRDSGEKLYRRSLYVYWKRTSPHPMMTLFDAPSREASCIARSRTNTPLQSLGLLNETQRVEMSRKFAERLMRANSNDNDRMNQLFELIACRKPTERERTACNDLLQLLSKRYSAVPEDAAALLSTGEASRDESLDPAHLAAWSQIVTTVLASDVAILMY